MGMKPNTELQKKMIATTIENQLNAEVTRRYADGTEVTASALEQAVATAVAKLIDKGDINDLLTLAKVLGQFKDAPTEVHLSKVDEDLEKRAIE
jgi:hypothetical protein